MFNYHSSLYKTKQKFFFHILETYKYVYICRYNELDSSALMDLKLELKKDQIFLYRLKQTVANSRFSWLKAQNSLILIYSNNKTALDLFLKLKNKTIQPLYLQYNFKKIISNLKLKKNLINLNNFNSILLKNHYLLINILLARRV